MKPEYTNKTVMNEDTCYDFLQLTWAKNGGIPRLVLLMAPLAALSYGISMLVVDGVETWPLAMSVFALGLFALLVGLFGWRFRAKKYIKAEKERWNSDTLEKEVLFFDDVFYQKSQLGEIQFPYEVVQEVRCNKTSAILSMARGSLLLRKDGFENASFEEFYAFIKEKTKNNRKRRRRKR